MTLKPPPRTQALAGFLLFIIVSLSSCKKEKEEPEEEEGLPIFGTCEPVSPSGKLTVISLKKFTYKTIGGGTINVDLDTWVTISHKDYPNFKVEFWGDTEEGENTAGSHENLNGKHMKDWNGTRRSVVFPDGAKVTFVSSWLLQPIISVTIYEGNEVHHFNATCHTLEYSTASSPFAKQLDDRDADGETSTFEITETGLLWKSIYNEDTPGNKVKDEHLIGELILENPNQVRDFVDDPRLGHT